MSPVIEGVRMFRAEGKYDFCDPSKVEAQLCVQFTLDGKRHTISDTVEPDGQYDFEPDDITEAVDAIGRALDRYLYASKREETKASIAVFHANEQAIRREWAKQQARKYQAIAARNSSLARAYLAEAMGEF